MSVEKEMSLGEFLRQEREKRNITIEQVASVTKVGIKTLHSLEEDSYTELPAKPFIRGFVISYCRFIGIDSKEVLTQYDEFLTQKTSLGSSREANYKGYAFERKDHDQQSRTLLLIGVFAFIGFGAVAMLILKPSLRHHRSSHIEKLRAAHSKEVEGSPLPDPDTVVGTETPQELKVAEAKPTEKAEAKVEAKTEVKAEEKKPLKVEQKPEEKKAEAKVEVKPTPKPLPPKVVEAPVVVAAKAPEIQEVPKAPAEKSEPGKTVDDPLDSGHGLKAEEIKHKLILKVEDDIWVRYQVDERPVRRFIIRKGKVLVLRAKDKVVVQVSKPKATSVKYNFQKSVLFDEISGAEMSQGNLTLHFPANLNPKLRKPFVNGQPLPDIPKAEPESFKQEKTS